MTEEQYKKCEEIINSYPRYYRGFVCNEYLFIPIALSLAKVFNKDITEKEAEKIVSDLKEDLKQNPKDKKYKDFESMSWAIVDKLDDELTLNLLILGQTGVGKSSLINALVGEYIEIFFNKDGIFPHQHEIDGKKVVIYDSWGLEVGKDEKWEKIINNALKEKGVDKDIKDWFHSVTYCIQAGGLKIQDFDIKMIKQFADEKYNIIIFIGVNYDKTYN